MMFSRRTLPTFLLLLLFWSVVAVSQSLTVDFRQAANNDRPYQLGDVHWVNSIVQRNNSAYYEGMSVPQRLMLTNIPASPGNIHMLTFSHKATKNGKHAYDFLTSYDQAITAASTIAGPTTLVNLNECGAAMGPPASLSSLCNTIRAGTHSFTVNVPDAMGSLLSHSIASSIANYETTFGNRTIKLYGNAPIFAASLVFNGYTSGKDADAEYTLVWTSTSTSILVEMATHLAMGEDVASAGSGIGYGPGLGAGSISGGSYHVSLGKLDGKSLGRRDNQIMGNAVALNIACNVGGPDIICVNSQNVYAFNTSMRGYTYAWTLTNNTSGASIVGSATGQSVTVHAGANAGGYVLTVAVSNGTQTVTCPFPVLVNGLGASSSPTPILCHGGTSEVTVTGHGGRAPYQGTGKFNRGAGKHTFIVTDASGCSAATSVTIPEPPPCSINASFTPILCPSGTSTVTITASGGTPPYSGTGTFTRPAGSYSFTISDANSCTATTQITITQPGTFNVSASATPILCGGGTSTVTVTATGGTPPYTGTGTFSRTAGTYSFTVTDANGCTASSASLTITEPPTLAASASVSGSAACGVGTAAVTVSATGGTPPYTGTGTFNRAPGTYNFTVTDANNCTAVATATVTGSPQLNVAATATSVLCPGGTSTVTVSATGGTPPFTGTGTFPRTAGTYTFTVTDAANCVGTATVTITEPPTFTVAASATPINCYGTQSTVTVTATGGTPPYTGTGVFSRGAGTYSFTVTDANGCTASSAALTITAPPQLTASASATQIVCGNNISTVTVTAAGGTPPYVGTGTFSRTIGTYTFTVTDANNCSAIASVTVTGTPAVSVTATATPITCGGGSSTVTVSATGGTPPYTGTGVFSRGAGTYTFIVTDAANCAGSATVTITEPPTLLATANASPILCTGGNSTVTVAASGGTPPYTGTGAFVRGPGNFSFTVTDANNCTAVTSVTITAPPALNVAATAQNILCHGDTTSVTVTATGGTAPYSGTGVFRRAAGTYTFTVTDANGCSASASLSIIQPPLLSASASATTAACNNGNATITVAATGGTPPYLGTGVFSRPQGTYTFVVTDANNCTASATVTVVSTSAIVATATAQPILCNGGTTTVTVMATGGTPPYTGTGAFVRGAGNYTFTVTDANNCQGIASINITEPPALNAAASGTPILCHGGSSTITVTASGGTPPYSGAGVFNRPAGNYTFTVTDANNCTATASVTVTEPTLLAAVANATPVSCNGGNSTITVTASGGTAPYSGTGVFARPAGSYTFTVTDANGCTATAAVTVTQPPTLTVSAIATPITCNGGTSTVTVTATGGTQPYTGTGAFIRAAGTYTFTVSDANNCSASVSVTITQPPVLGITASAPPILCNGDTTSVTIGATGGTAPYAGVGTFRRVAGVYSFTVTDANGCTATAQVSVVQPPQLVAVANITPILCNGDTATVDVTANGGTPPYSGIGSFKRRPGNFDFIVVDANGCRDTVSVTLTEPPALVSDASFTPILCFGGTSTVTVTATGGTPPYTGVGNVSRPAGTHVLTVTDANGCTDTTVVVIPQPPALLPAATATPIMCHGGLTTITVTATGGTPPYSGPGVYTRSAGTYSFSVTDANGCSAITTISIPDPPLLNASAFATPILCKGDSSTVTVTAYGGTQPYTGTGTFVRGAGNFTFVVTDANGCTASATVTITEPPLLVASSSGTPILCNGGNTTITVTASGGIPPYTGTGLFSRRAGTHTFVVTDANNCSAVTSVTITEPPALVVTASAPPILCHGDSATITITATGGTPPYIGVQTVRRAAGSYVFTVTDANGCTAGASITITQPPQLVADASATPILCFGDTSIVDITATGGTPPYSGVGRFGRRPGSFLFIVTDANGCVDTAAVTITEPPLLVATSTATPILCFGGTSTVTVSATGGTPPYSGIGNFSRPAGTHIFVVTDANGCEDSTIITITQPPPIVPVATATPILCKGGHSNVTVSATGGTPGYSGTGVFTRPAGTYTFTVTDANGCTAQVTIVVPEPPQLHASVFATPILCYGDSATVTVTAYGGTAPYSGTGVSARGPGRHTFVVTDANGCTASTDILISEPPPLIPASSAPPILCNGGTTTVTVTASGGTPPYSGTGAFSKPAGTHIFTVTDSNGCTATTTITITEPPLLQAAATAPPLTCSYDYATVTVTASGGTPPYSGTGTFSRPKGIHTFTVTDANGCTASVSIGIVGPPPLVAAAVATPILCNGGMTNVTVTASGGTPGYIGTGTYIRGAGLHTFIVRDVNNCADTVQISIFEPPPLVVICDVTPCDPVTGTRTISSNVHGGTPPYTYHWSPGNINTPTFTVPCHDNQTYTLVVRDANWNPNNPYNAGCQGSCVINLVGFTGDDPVDNATARSGDGRGRTSDGRDTDAEDPAFGTRKTTPAHAPDEYALFENYPNPFNPTTTIRYYVPEASYVRLTVINAFGQVVATLVDDLVEAGTHYARWNAKENSGTAVPSGSYFYRMHATAQASKREFLRERLMLLLR
ncbi:MAG: hypothetical protein M5R41_06185 [Bacteroidia bacterium]|nr:hypothetical protein [Bacteroidia bacterium]